MTVQDYEAQIQYLISLQPIELAKMKKVEDERNQLQDKMYRFTKEHNPDTWHENIMTQTPYVETRDNFSQMLNNEPIKRFAQHD